MLSGHDPRRVHGEAILGDRCRASMPAQQEEDRAMASGDLDKTRAFARLPGLDIVVLHRAPRGGDGEQVVAAVRTAPPFGVLERPVGIADSLLLWMGLAHAVWTSWLGCLAAASAPPWTTRDH